MIEKVRLKEKFALFQDNWHPKRTKPGWLYSIPQQRLTPEIW